MTGLGFTSCDHLQVAARKVLALVLASGVLFGAYGGLGYAEAWIFLGISTATKVIFRRLLMMRDPELVERRERLQKGTKGWDKVWLSFYALAFLAMLGVAGLDAGRYHWSTVQWWGVVAGTVVYLAAVAFTYRAMVANTHFEGTVRIQTDRDHKVVDTGPYRYVRHPGYVAFIALMASIPPLLGSFYAFIPAAGVGLLFILRTHLEDRTLHRELNGYAAYAVRVRYRLVPGVW